MVVKDTVYQSGKRRRALVCCINVIAQPQEIRAGCLLGIFVPLEEDQSYKGSSVDLFAGVRDGPDMCKFQRM